MTPRKGIGRTPPTSAPLAADLANMQHAIESAAAGLAEGGVPIGACLVNNRTGEVLGVGRNRRVQMGSAIRHGETDCLENVGRLPASVYRECTIYTTLSPCAMCTGACILYEIPRVVIGENESFLGAEQTLKAHRIKVHLQECKVMMKEFIDMKPEVWWEDIGEEKRANEA
ncbi:cytosine deaminase [Exidia glandulosa HHB12029]|uniref:Cytosine deaminase n=1 Tax=Exidia glandulosa HHB12029 TaxID=1314781 RepID=A0A165HB21_EXIGL|nr:cytosine deaminase [Exidia glandulosa HHB12029]